MSRIRISTIASFITKEDKVADIGCDHAYLAILLIKEKLCDFVIASDINQNALKNAQQNIKKEKLEKEIPIVLSDGLDKIDQDNIDTIVISGMGTSTIFHIIQKVKKERIKKIILQSNNDLHWLRKKMPTYGYFLQDEKIIFEKGHYYSIGNYTQKRKIRKLRELYFGIYKEEYKEYYQFLYNDLLKINKKIPFKQFRNKILILYKIYLIKKYL